MLSRRSLLVSSAGLAAGCRSLESSLSVPSLPKVVDLKWGTWHDRSLFESGRRVLAWQKAVAQVVEALATDSENPNGPKKGRYRLTPHYDRSGTGWDEMLAWYGREFDLFSVTPGLAQYILAERGMVLPLDPFIAIDGADVTRAFYPALLDQFRSESGLFALPVDANPMMLHYDPEYFEEKGVPPVDASWDWDNLVENALKLTQRYSDGEARRWGLAIERFGYWWAFWQNEADVMDPKSLQCMLQERAAAEALEFCRDLLHRHRVAPLRVSTARWRPFDRSLGPPPAMFFVPHLDLPWDTGFRWALLPRGRVRSVPLGGNSGIAISAKSKHPEVAYTALKGLVGVMQPFVRAPAQKAAVAKLGDYNKRLLPQEVAAIQQSMEHGRGISRSLSAHDAMQAIEQRLVRGDDAKRIVDEVCTLIED